MFQKPHCASLQNVTGDLSRNYAEENNPKISNCFRRKLTKQKRESWNLKNGNLKNMAFKIENGKAEA